MAGVDAASQAQGGAHAIRSRAGERPPGMIPEPSAAL